MSPVRPSPPESVTLKAVLAVLRHHMGWCELEELVEAVAANEDWHQLMRFAARHRVPVLLRLELLQRVRGELPEALVPTMQDELQTLLMTNRRQLRALQHLVRRFEGAGVRALPYKGPALAALAFGGQIRPCTDLDILVPLEDLYRARDLLVEEGYRQNNTPISGRDGRPHRHDLEIQLTRPGPGPGEVFEVELHWRLFSDHFAMPVTFEDLWRERHHLELANGRVPTLGNADHALVVGMHGHKHRWLQLRWLLDYAALLSRLSDEDWQRSCDLWREAKLEGEHALALELVGRLMGSAAPPRLADAAAALPDRRDHADRVWEDLDVGAVRGGSRKPFEVFLSVKHGTRARLIFACRYLDQLVYRRFLYRKLFEPEPGEEHMTGGGGGPGVLSTPRRLAKVVWEYLGILVRVLARSG